MKGTRRKGVRFGIRSGNTLKRCPCCMYRLRLAIAHECKEIVDAKVEQHNQARSPPFEQPSRASENTRLARLANRVRLWPSCPSSESGTTSEPEDESHPNQPKGPSEQQGHKDKKKTLIAATKQDFVRHKAKTWFGMMRYEGNPVRRVIACDRTHRDGSAKHRWNKDHQAIRHHRKATYLRVAATCVEEAIQNANEHSFETLKATCKRYD